MGDVTALRVYRDYLEAIDDEAQRVANDEEYLDLLTEAEVVDLLCARDTLKKTHLSVKQRQELARLDDLLIKHYRLVSENTLPFPDKPRTHWWWHLHEGPNVRHETLARTGSD